MTRLLVIGLDCAPPSLVFERFADATFVAWTHRLPDDQHHAFIAERLVAAGIPVDTIHPEKLKLEDVFLRLTKGVVQWRRFLTPKCGGTDSFRDSFPRGATARTGPATSTAA